MTPRDVFRSVCLCVLNAVETREGECRRVHAVFSVGLAKTVPSEEVTRRDGRLAHCGENTASAGDGFAGISASAKRARAAGRSSDTERPCNEIVTAATVRGGRE